MLAVTLAVAGIAVALPFFDDLWLALAYEEDATAALEKADVHMTVHFKLGDEHFATQAEWKRRRNGWHGRFPR